MHLVESAKAPARTLAIVGLMSDSFCVKPDQPADSVTDGPQLDDAAFTPHPAACSRSRSALSVRYCWVTAVTRFVSAPTTSACAAVSCAFLSPGSLSVCPFNVQSSRKL